MSTKYTKLLQNKAVGQKVNHRGIKDIHKVFQNTPKFWVFCMKIYYLATLLWTFIGKDCFVATLGRRFVFTKMTQIVVLGLFLSGRYLRRLKLPIWFLTGLVLLGADA
jgi:hypothetical protein